MKRRAFLALPVVGALAEPFAPARAQDARVLRVGFLEAGTASANQHFLDAFLAGLRASGYAPGGNAIVEVRWAEGRTDRFGPLLAELIASRPDVLVVASTVGAVAAAAATRSIPVVFVGAADPVGLRVVESLARPGGNVTGLSRAAEDGTTGKLAQLIREILPSATRVGMLLNPTAAIEPRQRDAERALRASGLTPTAFEVRDRDAFVAAFARMRERRIDALLTIADPLTMVNRGIVVELAAKHRIPGFYEFAEFARAGGLIAYAPNVADLFRRAAIYVDRIFKGASPAELPVEQATLFDLVVNLRAAGALGLTIPPSILLRADEVIR